jgi:NCAIR mutase (PurE)-related proteins
MEKKLALHSIFEAVSRGAMTIEEGMKRIQGTPEPIEELGFAQIDYQRKERQGFSEVVYCEGKTDEQSLTILKSLAARHDQVLGTRASKSLGNQAVAEISGAIYHPLSRVITIEKEELPKDSERYILVISAGTSDIPVAEEAALTAKIMGNRVETLYDVGVAGIHRLFAQMELIRKANVVIVAAGMEGALPSVVGGLVEKPVIALPTSIGYGASFGGIAALLGMLNSCAAGVSVVNIDNGFGAGRLAHLINQMR